MVPDPTAVHSTSGQVAAFFDLDKTVIARSSALAFTPRFYAGGLLTRRSLARSIVAQVTSALPARNGHEQVERLRRHVIDMCAGWEVERVHEIVAGALQEVIAPLVFPGAATLIASHHRRGHDVILVSASGRELVEPIGAMLGVDRVRASALAVVDGRYAGDLDFYCYGEQKAHAVAAEALGHRYDLSRSYAYSDSVTDLPMLSAVGHPVAVNPDRHLRRAARERGWPILDFTLGNTSGDGRGEPARRALATLAVGIAGVVAVTAIYRAARGRRV